MCPATDIAIIAVDGDLDVTSVPRVRAAVDAAMRAGCKRVVLNMDGVEHADSTGIGFVLRAIQTLRNSGGLLSLVNVHDRVMRAFRLARIVDFAPVSEAGPRPEVSALPPDAQPLWRCAFRVNPEHLDDARHRIGTLLKRMDLSPDEVFDATLAAGEAVGNAIDHTGAETVVTVSGYADRAVVEVSDCGCGFELAVGDAKPTAGPAAERGRGIALMRLLADSVSIDRRPSGTGTCVRLVKLVHRSSADE